jgi:hypothetical protein
VEDEDSLVFVLIDEVESLTAARTAAVSGSEPSDAIRCAPTLRMLTTHSLRRVCRLLSRPFRCPHAASLTQQSGLREMHDGAPPRVVNALLTQLDALKNYPNVMVLTTTNITQAVDLAFVYVPPSLHRLPHVLCGHWPPLVLSLAGSAQRSETSPTSRLGADDRQRTCPDLNSDRADLKVYIGPPNTHARYEILRSCLMELQRVGIIQPVRAAVPDPSLSRAPRRVSVPRRRTRGSVDTHTHTLCLFRTLLPVSNLYELLQEGWELPAFTELQSPMDAPSPAAAKEAEASQPSRREGEADDMCMDHGTPGTASQPSRAQTCGAMLLSVAQDIEVRRHWLPRGKPIGPITVTALRQS